MCLFCLYYKHSHCTIILSVLQTQPLHYYFVCITNTAIALLFCLYYKHSHCTIILSVLQTQPLHYYFVCITNTAIALLFCLYYKHSRHCTIILSVLQTQPLHYYFVCITNTGIALFCPSLHCSASLPLPVCSTWLKRVGGHVLGTLLGFITGTAQKTMLPHCISISSRHFPLFVDAIVKTTCKRKRQYFMCRF